MIESICENTRYGISNYRPKSDKLLREVVDDHKHDLKRQTLLHEQIRNDEDYDDWDYGTKLVTVSPL